MAGKGTARRRSPRAAARARPAGEHKSADRSEDQSANQRAAKSAANSATQGAVRAASEAASGGGSPGACNPAAELSPSAGAERLVPRPEPRRDVGGLAAGDAGRLGGGGPSGGGGDGPPLTASNPIDRFFGLIRLHHLFNALAVSLVAALALRAPQLTVLPLYLALIARVPVTYLRGQFGFTFPGAVLCVVLMAFLVLIATILALVLPVILQAVQLDSAAFERARPIVQELVQWSRESLAALGVDVAALGAEFDLTPEGVVDLLTKSVDDSVAFMIRASGAILQPVLFIGLTLLVVFMASYALGYSNAIRRETSRFLRVCWPERTVDLAERWVAHLQHYGSEVFRGYSWMVLVLGLSYFFAYLGAIMLFPEASDLPPVFVLALVVLSGIVGAVPGLGAKVLLALGALVGLAVGLAATIFTGSVWLGVYIFAAYTIVTGFESKFGTPNTLGRALGVNSAFMLYLAIATVAAYGLGATLWTVFVILPAMVAAMRLMVETYGDKDASAGPR